MELSLGIPLFAHVLTFNNDSLTDNYNLTGYFIMFCNRDARRWSDDERVPDVVQLKGEEHKLALISIEIGHSIFNWEPQIR